MKAAAKSANKPGSRRLSRNRAAYAYLCPWIIGFTCFTLFPIIFMFYTSLTNRKLNGLSEFVGFTNYINMFKSDTFLNSLKVTILFSVCMVIVDTIWAIVLALLLNQKRKGNGIFQFFYFLPAVIPSIAISYAFRTIFGKDAGLLNSMLTALLGRTVSVNWLYDSGTVYPAVFFVTLFTYGTGQMMLIYRSALGDVPKELYEAYDMDGGNAFGKFFHVTLPMISPIVLFNTLNGAISALNGSFGLLYPLTGESGNPNGMTQVLSLLVYKEAFSNLKVGYACALSVILFLLAALFGAVIFRASKNTVHYEY